MGVQFPPLRVSRQCSEPQLRPSPRLLVRLRVEIFFSPVKIPGFGLSEAEPGLKLPARLESEGLQEGADSRRLRPCAACLQRAQMTPCIANAPRFSHFLPGRTGRSSLRGSAACPGTTAGGGIAGCPRGRAAAGPRGGCRRPGEEGGRPAGSAPRPAAPLPSAPPGPQVCVNKAGHGVSAKRALPGGREGGSRPSSPPAP